MSRQLHFQARERKPLEALDLGLALLRQDLKPIFQIFSLQMAVLLALILPFTYHKPAWTLLALWWLSPWLHRGTLYVLSRRVFGLPANRKAFLRDFTDIHRHGLLASLTWRRLHPTFCFSLAVLQLEGQRGAAFRKRAQVLRRATQPILWLYSGLCLLLLAATLLGSLALIEMMAPGPLRIDVFSQMNVHLDKAWFSPLATLLMVFAFAVIEPIHAAGAFALYLNRRTQLEAWDIEQSFRRLALRLASALFIFSFSASSLLAQTPEAPPAVVQSQEAAQDMGEDTGEETREETPEEDPQPLQPEDEARKQIEHLLEHDDELRKAETFSSWEYRPTGQEPAWLRAMLDALFAPNQTSDPFKPAQKSLQAWWPAAATLLKVMVILGLVGLALWLLIRFQKLKSTLPPTEDYTAPEALSGLDIRQASLPSNVTQVALEFYLAGKMREALALLYRATLSELVHRHAMQIPHSSTENECLRLILPHLEATKGLYFKQLTQLWVKTAYQAHIDATLAEAHRVQLPRMIENWGRLIKSTPHDVKNREAQG